MAIAVLSIWWAEALFRYARTRLPARIAVPAVLFLSAAAAAGAPPRGVGELVRRVGLAWALFTLLRLRDDLADREGDRARHPERVLVRAPALAPFWACAGLLVALTTSLLVVGSAPGPALLTFFGLLASLAAWYRWRRAHPVSSLAHAHIVLLKYPGIVALQAAGDPSVRAIPLGLGMLLTYLSFLLYELLHDDGLRDAPGTRRVVGLEMVLLAAIPLLGTEPTASGPRAPTPAGIALAIGGLLVLVRLHLDRATLRPGTRATGAFLVGLLYALHLWIGGISS